MGHFNMGQFDPFGGKRHQHQINPIVNCWIAEKVADSLQIVKKFLRVRNVVLEGAKLFFVVKF